MSSSATFWKPGETKPGTSKSKNDEIKLKTSSKNSKSAPQRASSKGKAASHSLSTATLAMKFMSRKQEAKDQEEAERERKEKQLAGQWVLREDMIDQTTDRLVCLQDDPSHTSLPSRRSFGGFNPLIEDWSRQAETVHRMTKHEENEARGEVSEDEMTTRMEKYVGLRGKKASKGQGMKREGQKNQKSPHPKKARRT